MNPSPYLFALLALASSACMVTTGQVATVTMTPNVTPGAVKAIAVDGAADVDVTIGAAESVVLECDSGLVSHVHIEKRGDVLHVATDRGYRSWGDAKCVAKIGVLGLEGLEVGGSGDAKVRGKGEGIARVSTSGSGDIVVEDMAADTMTIESTGSGDVKIERLSARTLNVETTGSGAIKLAGASDSATLTSSGSGSVRASGLATKRLDVHVSGSGDVSSNATEAADVEASGSGDVVVTGHPTQRQASRSGSGDISFR